jgi:hypothetical protein
MTEIFLWSVTYLIKRHKSLMILWLKILEYLWIFKSFEVKSDDKFWYILGAVNFEFLIVEVDPQEAYMQKTFELDIKV